ncbi:uncharacterized protein B0T23DRAFT_431557 [Neurospora hispaniola]|uniref:Uncharacterized protein n=1 Tax=Neurospora hispaniola TaxID=588809 RepID=A0AAJ0I2I3_9PEZI|nr:hypothetical protein B0T23DRAFT_431557 [Neurospora hispaniola]
MGRLRPSAFRVQAIMFPTCPFSSPTILLILKLAKESIDEMSEVIVSKIPEQFQDFAKSFTVPRFESVDEAINTYKLS